MRKDGKPINDWPQCLTAEWMKSLGYLTQKN